MVQLVVENLRDTVLISIRVHKNFSVVLDVVAVDVEVILDHCGSDAGVVLLALNFNELSDFIAVWSFSC